MTDLLVALILSLPLVGAYAILSVGIVMIYRASGVLNLAHGGMMMVPPYILYTLSAQLSLPLVVSLPLALASGGFLGIAVERVFIRPLRKESVTAQTVGTVAALGILIAIAAKVWGTTGLPAVQVFPQGRLSVGLSSISYGQIGLFVVMLIVTGTLIYLFQHTDLGLLMRGTSENATAASLMGVDPQRITTLSWAMGGALAGLTGIMFASVTTTMQPFSLALQALPGFVGALLGGLGALMAAALGAAVVGFVTGLVPLLGSLGDSQGAPQLFLAILAIVVMAMRGRGLVAGGTKGGGLGGGAAARALGGSAEIAKAARPLRERPLLIAGIVGMVIFPWLPFVPFSILGTANQAAQFALVAVSLVLLTGWVGQISLGHAAFVGIGAYVTGLLAGGLGLPFPANLPIAALASAAIAIILGRVAVRVRGLYLAVATLIFSWMCSEWLFRQDWFTQHSLIENRPVGTPGTFPFFDFADRRIFYVIAWAFVGFAVLAASNLRQSKTGRAFFAVQGSETAAASLGIDVVRYKMIAFSLSGFLAGAAGNLIMADSRAIVPEQFTFTWSLFFVAVAVVGGLRSLGGAVAAGALFAGLNEVFFRVEMLGGYLDIVSNGLLAIVLLAYREGLAAIPESLVSLGRKAREATAHAKGVTERAAHVVGDAKQRIPVPRLGPAVRHLPGVGHLAARATGDWGVLVEEAAAGVSPNGSSIHDDEQPDAIAMADFEPDAEPDTTNGDGSTDSALQTMLASVERVDPATRGERRPMIEALDITVRFGGLVAVDDATLKVHEGEIVGLIGPNGAGKTTLFNSISGLNRPTEGKVLLMGQEVTDLPVHERAKVGVARTFQQIQLFSQLTVLDNLVVATHVHNPTGFLSHLLATPSSVHEELDGRKRATSILYSLGLGDVADARVADLPFGVLRMVEVARALATNFPVIMLDEAASGLDNRETEQLMEMLLKIREQGRTLLLIEHDVQMVTSLSDYMYVLDRGIMIAEGSPDAVKRNEAVIAAYLGAETTEDAPATVG